MNALELIRAAVEPKPSHDIVDAFKQLATRLGNSSKKLTHRGYKIDVDGHPEAEIIILKAAPLTNPTQAFGLTAYEVTDRREPAIEVETYAQGKQGKLSTLRGNMTADDLLKKLIQALFERIEAERPGRAHAATEPNQPPRVTPTELFEFTSSDRKAVRAVFPAGTAELLCYEHDESDGTAEFEVNVHPVHGDDDWSWNIGCGFVNLKFDATKRLIHMDAVAEKKVHTGLKKTYPWPATLTPPVLMRAIVRDLNAVDFLEKIVKANT